VSELPIKVLEVQLQRPIEASELPDLLKKVATQVPLHSVGPCVLVISGRLPVWAFAALVHFYHPVFAVCTMDPRYQGGVVVASHHPAYKVGDIVKVERAEKFVVVYP